MNFSQAITRIPDTTTTNGASAFTTTLNANLDFFASVPSGRTMDVNRKVQLFTAAYKENADLAIRNLLHLRDVRGGAGERNSFRELLGHLATVDQGLAARVITRIPELGRWDDLLQFIQAPMAPSTQLEELVVGMVVDELSKAAEHKTTTLCAKWMPRQGAVAKRFCSLLEISPRQWRKTLVACSQTVEQAMCGNKWDEINFSHVPSVAANRYRKAFTRHQETRYNQWVADVAAGKEGVKVNAGAIFPHTILGSVYGKTVYTQDQINQWNALPNYVGNHKILPMIDVSGSMDTSIDGGKTRAMDVAIALGLYCAERCTSEFQDCFLTFSAKPKLMNVKGMNFNQKINTIRAAEWGMNTNLQAAFQAILDLAKRHNIAQSDMPTHLLILSDMQFDQATSSYPYSTPSATLFETMQQLYQNAGYIAPVVVFWNLAGNTKNVPVRADEKSAVLISGFSPAMISGVLSAQFPTPQSIMVDKLMSERYNY